MKIFSKQNKIIYDGEVDDDSYAFKAVMEDSSLTLRIRAAEHIEIPLGSYTDFQGERYSLLRPENLRMNHSRSFDYIIIMQAASAKLQFWKLRNTVDGRLKFTLTAKPTEHLQMIVANLNQRENGWTVGECPDETEHTICYDHHYLSDALATIADEFKTEYEIKGRTISLRKVEYNKTNPLPLSYGRGNGFVTGVGRNNESDTPPVEILYVQGGERNIDPSQYKHKQLLLPAGGLISYDGEKFEDEEGFNPDNARGYKVTDDRLAIYRPDTPLRTMAEDSLDCSDIYPRREGKVTAVKEVDKDKHFYDFTDDSIPADLDFEKCKIEGENTTVIFQTGMLAGREFDVNYFHEPNSVTKKEGRRFEIIPSEIDGETMPNEIFKPAAGDKYAVFNCRLPEAYLNAYHKEGDKKEGAEWDMMRQAVKYKYDNEDEKFTFTGKLDGIWAKKDWTNIGGRILVGGFILFTDERFQKEGVKVRITAVKQYINNPHSPEVTLSNATITGSIAGTIKDIQAAEQQVEESRRQAVDYTKRRWRDARETADMLQQLIDSKTNALTQQFTDAIAPLNIQTMQMLVGDESLQFRYLDIQTHRQVDDGITYSSETRQMHCPGARIVQHMTLGIKDISSTLEGKELKAWEVSEFTSARLEDAAQKYYIYLCAPRDTTTRAEYRLQTNPLPFQVEANYNMLVGILNSEYEGERSLVTLYGFTEILPSRITTEKITSGDGSSYFDMKNNAMKLGNVLDFNREGDGKLRLKGTIVQSQSGEESPIGCYRGAWNRNTSYYEGDEVTYETNGSISTYRNIRKGTGILPTNTDFWRITAQGVQGTAGEYTEYRFFANGSKTEAPELVKTDPHPTGWELTQPAPKEFWYVWATKARKTTPDKLAEPWCTPYRVTPYDGTDGRNGKDGKDGTNGKDGKNGSSPVAIFQGDYDPAKTYYGNATRLDCVKYDGAAYIAQITAGEMKGIPPTNTAKWNPFGGTFDSVATSLLLAEGANIAGWIFKNNRLYSQNDVCYLDGRNGNISGVGLIRRNFFHLTEENKRDYFIWDGELVSIDYTLTGSLISVECTLEIDGITATGYLPSIDAGYQHAAVFSTDFWRERARSFIGAQIIIYNNSTKEIPISGAITETEGGDSFYSTTVKVGEIGVFTCKLEQSKKYGSEQIYWLLRRIKQ